MKSLVLSVALSLGTMIMGGSVVSATPLDQTYFYGYNTPYGSGYGVAQSQTGIISYGVATNTWDCGGWCVSNFSNYGWNNYYVPTYQTYTTTTYGAFAQPYVNQYNYIHNYCPNLSVYERFGC